MKQKGHECVVHDTHASAVTELQRQGAGPLHLKILLPSWPSRAWFG